MLKQNQVIPRRQNYISKNRLRKAKKIAELTQKHYEPGRHDRCLEWVYEYIVNKQYPMHLRTFRRYIQIADEQLGYCFRCQNREKTYLFDIYARMQPKTIEKVKEICGQAQHTGLSGQTDVYKELQERYGLDTSISLFRIYLAVGVYCMDYEIECLKKS